MSEPKFDEPSSPEKKPSRNGDYVKVSILIGGFLALLLLFGGYSLFNIARRLDNKAPVDAKAPELSDETYNILQAFDAYPWVGILLILMFADVLTGILAGVVLKRISSKVSWQGMAKKSIVLILVGVSAVVESQTSGIPLAKLVASAFSISELVSILENASRSGIIIPKPLAEFVTSVLQKPAKAKPLHIEKVSKMEVHQHVNEPKSK